jgi:hypothetical protein
MDYWDVERHEESFDFKHSIEGTAWKMLHLHGGIILKVMWGKPGDLLWKGIDYFR